MAADDNKQSMTEFFQSVGFVTVVQAAERTGVAHQKISQWARTGEITAKFVGRQAVLPECAIEEIQAIAANWTGENDGRKANVYKSVLREQLADFLTLTDAAPLVERDAMTLRRWIASGKLDGYRFGRHQVFVKRSDIEEIRANVAAGRGPFERAESSGREP